MLTTRLTSLTQHDAWNEICCLCPFQRHALLLCIASPERAGRLLATSKPAIIQAGHNSQFIIIAASPGWNICVALPSHFPWREHQNKQGSFYLGGKRSARFGEHNKLPYFMGSVFGVERSGLICQPYLQISNSNKFCTHFAQWVESDREWCLATWHGGRGL